MVTENANPWEYGPYIQVAAFCDRVLQEGDGVLSLIRVVDVITHTVAGQGTPEEMPPVTYPLNLVLTLKAGRARGRHELTITPELPSGEALPPVTASVRFEGEGRGTNVISKIQMEFRFEGLYWFNIRLDNRILTRLPLEVRYARMSLGGPPAPL